MKELNSRGEKRIQCEAVDIKPCSWGLSLRDFHMYVKDRTRMSHCQVSLFIDQLLVCVCVWGALLISDHSICCMKSNSEMGIYHGLVFLQEERAFDSH